MRAGQGTGQIDHHGAFERSGSACRVEGHRIDPYVEAR
ncbi:hypothetical protein NY08_4021 [Rhodococcus sp. B7740]|nr:hypothetical protein NY08_4021 [Rhodococcus sp. B7740]